LPIIPPLEISGNSGVVKLKALGGLLERRGIVEFLDGLPLSFGDFQNQRIVEPIDQVYGFVEVLVAGRKSSQDLEFEEIAGLDAFDGFPGGLKCFAAEAVYGRLNVAGWRAGRCRSGADGVSSGRSGRRGARSPQ